MGTFVTLATVDENAELTTLSNSSDEVISRRATCILMSAEGQTTAQIAEILSLSERSVRNAVSAFNKQGMQSLQRAIVPGRPRRLSDISTDAITELLEESPHSRGIDADYWSLDSFASALANAFQLTGLSRDTVGRELRRRGVDWLQEKQARVITRLSTMGARTVKENRSQAPDIVQSPPPRPSEKNLYADYLLSVDEQKAYDAAVSNLRKEFSEAGAIEEMHIQLAAVYFIRLAQAQADEDWDKAEHLDHMLRSQMTELKARKKKQEPQVSRSVGVSPAEWASELLERYRTAVAEGSIEDTPCNSVSEMSREESRALINEGYEKWKREKLAQQEE